MLAPIAPGIAMASCRQWSTPGTSLLSAVLRPWYRASLPRPPTALFGVAAVPTDPRFRAVTVGHPLATVWRVVARVVRSEESGPVIQLSTSSPPEAGEGDAWQPGTHRKRSPDRASVVSG